MKLSCEAAICIEDERHGDYVHTITVHGSVWETQSEAELGVHVDDVQGLPHWLELPDLSDIQQEACALALQAEYGRIQDEQERRERLQERMVQELKRLVGSLRRTLEDRPDTHGDIAAHERIGALTFVVQMAQDKLEKLVREAA